MCADKLDGCTALRSAKALSDASLTPQFCVGALSVQIDLNCCDGLSGALKPHPPLGLSVQSFLSVRGSCTSLAPSPLSSPAQWPPDYLQNSLQWSLCSAHPPLVQWGCTPAMGSPLSSPWAACCSWVPCPEGAVLPLLLCGALLPSSEHLKMRVHFGKAILPCYSCCWLAFIKQQSYWCFSKTGVTFSPHLNQRSFLQPSSTQACLLSAYLGCSFLSGLHHFVSLLLLMKAPALLLCHTSLLPQLTSWSHWRWADQKWEEFLGEQWADVNHERSCSFVGCDPIPEHVRKGLSIVHCIRDGVKPHIWGQVIPDSWVNLSKWGLLTSPSHLTPFTLLPHAQHFPHCSLPGLVRFCWANAMH